jgi:hypothetical protein
MASRGKKKTTFAKLAREHRLRERRLDKQIRKDARKQAAEEGPTELGDAAETQIDEDGDGDDSLNADGSPTPAAGNAGGR